MLAVGSERRAPLLLQSWGQAWDDDRTAQLKKRNWTHLRPAHLRHLSPVKECLVTMGVCACSGSGERARSLFAGAVLGSGHGNDERTAQVKKKKGRTFQLLPI